MGTNTKKNNRNSNKNNSLSNNSNKTNSTDTSNKTTVDWRNEKQTGSELKRGKTSMFTRIFAILGLIVIAGLYVLSLVASLSDWENAFGIFVGALAATIFVPIVIYLFKLFSNRDS